MNIFGVGRFDNTVKTMKIVFDYFIFNIECVYLKWKWFQIVVNRLSEWSSVEIMNELWLWLNDF